MKIRDQVAEIIDAPIPEGHWQDVFNALDSQGKLTMRVFKDLLIILCTKIDEMEDAELTPPVAPTPPAV